jgi:hypothetical protein
MSETPEQKSAINCDKKTSHGQSLENHRQNPENGTDVSI